MTELSFRFRPRYARRIPDPNFKDTYNLERHLFVMPVQAMPTELPLDPNARTPNIKKRVYQQVEKSLLNQECEPNTFHLKNKGITIVANGINQVGDNDYVVTMQSGLHGIVDGGHTYKLITKHLNDEELPENQFVAVEIRIGVPDQWIPDIAGGLNTSVQVEDMSLDNLSAMFEWMKDEIRNQPYYHNIAWSENEPGALDARDLISLMTMFNIELFPNKSDDHPVMAYEKKSLALKEFEKKSLSYQRLRPILKDILQLHDIIRQEARGVWNKAGGKGGALAFMDSRKRGEHTFPITGKQDKHRLMNGALYPILAAFRWYVVQDLTTMEMKWRDGFDAVVQVWRDIGAELLKATQNVSLELGRNANAIGKSRNHWANLHTRIAKYDLEKRVADDAA